MDITKAIYLQAEKIWEDFIQFCVNNPELDSDVLYDKYNMELIDDLTLGGRKILTHLHPEYEMHKWALDDLREWGEDGYIRRTCAISICIGNSLKLLKDDEIFYKFDGELDLSSYKFNTEETIG